MGIFLLLSNILQTNRIIRFIVEIICRFSENEMNSCSLNWELIDNEMS